MKIKRLVLLVALGLGPGALGCTDFTGRWDGTCTFPGPFHAPTGFEIEQKGCTHWDKNGEMWVIGSSWTKTEPDYPSPGMETLHENDSYWENGRKTLVLVMKSTSTEVETGDVTSREYAVLRHFIDPATGALKKETKYHQEYKNGAGNWQEVNSNISCTLKKTYGAS